MATESCETVLPRFKELARQVWGDVIDELELTCRPKVDKTHDLASLRWPGGCNPQAMNGEKRGHLIRACNYYVLEVTPRLLDLPVDKLDKILKHEAIHLGYSRHDKNFFKLAEVVGAPYSEIGLEGNKVRIQVKEGSRYKDVLYADSFEEAKQKGLDYAKAHPWEKVRLSL